MADFGTQTELIEMAFAGDDLIEQDFEEEKNRQADLDAPKSVDVTLPGWGAWSGAGITRKPKQFTKQVAGINPQQRRDSKLQKVIISERRDKKFAKKYTTDRVPFPYKTREQYEASLQMPLGKDWNTHKMHSKMVKPRIQVKAGKVIAPLKYTKQPTD